MVVAVGEEFNCPNIVLTAVSCLLVPCALGFSDVKMSRQLSSNQATLVLSKI